MNEDDPAASGPSGFETEDRPQASGTLIDAFQKTRPRDRARRGLMIVMGLLFMGLTAWAGVLILHPGEHESLSAVALVKEASEAMEAVAQAPTGPGAPPETLKPTGRTLPKMVYVDSLPAGAEVRIGGELLGVTPLMIGRAYDGDFAEVELRHPGYHPWKGRVQIVEHGIRADVTLRPR